MPPPGTMPKHQHHHHTKISSTAKATITTEAKIQTTKTTKLPNKNVNRIIHLSTTTIIVISTQQLIRPNNPLDHQDAPAWNRSVEPITKRRLKRVEAKPWEMPQTNEKPQSPIRKKTKRRERQTLHASSSQAPPQNIHDFKISPLYFLKEG